MDERPLECSRCKKEADVTYSEVIGGEMSTVRMCRDCPILQEKLHGSENPGLCCENCKTSLESILMGNPLGCKECYEIFHDVLVDQLIELDHISPRLRPNEMSKHSTLHIGKTPYSSQDAFKSKRLSSLNEALSDALSGENYEQAAWIRDKINTLMETSS